MSDSASTQDIRDTSHPSAVPGGPGPCARRFYIMVDTTLLYTVSTRGQSFALACDRALVHSVRSEKCTAGLCGDACTQSQRGQGELVRREDGSRCEQVWSAHRLQTEW